MSKHEARITSTHDGEFYALIVRIDRDSEESVINGYAGRHFKTYKGAVRSTNNYMAKWGL